MTWYVLATPPTPVRAFRVGHDPLPGWVWVYRYETRTSGLLVEIQQNEKEQFDSWKTDDMFAAHNIDQVSIYSESRWVVANRGDWMVHAEDRFWSMSHEGFTATYRLFDETGPSLQANPEALSLYELAIRAGLLD